MNRKHLANMRVVQKNLVYVVGLSSKLAKEEVSWSDPMSSIDDMLTPPHSRNPPADPDAQEQRVLWAVWSNLQDPHLQEDDGFEVGDGDERVEHCESYRERLDSMYADHLAAPSLLAGRLRNVPSQRGCSEGYRSHRRQQGSGRQDSAGKLRHHKVLHDLPPQSSLHQPGLHLPPRAGRGSRQLYQGGSQHFASRGSRPREQGGSSKGACLSSSHIFGGDRRLAIAFALTSPGCPFIGRRVISGR